MKAGTCLTVFHSSAVVGYWLGCLSPTTKILWQLIIYNSEYAQAQQLINFNFHLWKHIKLGGGGLVTISLEIWPCRRYTYLVFNNDSISLCYFVLIYFYFVYGFNIYSGYKRRSHAEDSTLRIFQQRCGIHCVVDHTLGQMSNPFDCAN